MDMTRSSVAPVAAVVAAVAAVNAAADAAAIAAAVAATRAAAVASFLELIHCPHSGKPIYIVANLDGRHIDAVAAATLLLSVVLLLLLLPHLPRLLLMLLLLLPKPIHGGLKESYSMVVSELELEHI